MVPPIRFFDDGWVMRFAALPHAAPLPAGYLGRTSAKSVPVVTAVSRNPTDEYCGRHSADYANAKLPL